MYCSHQLPQVVKDYWCWISLFTNDNSSLLLYNGSKNKLGRDDEMILLKYLGQGLQIRGPRRLQHKLQYVITSKLSVKIIVFCPQKCLGFEWFFCIFGCYVMTDAKIVPNICSKLIVNFEINLKIQYYFC